MKMPLEKPTESQLLQNYTIFLVDSVSILATLFVSFFWLFQKIFNDWDKVSITNKIKHFKGCFPQILLG